MADWYTTLGGEHCSDPGSIGKFLSDRPFGESLPLWQRANSYTCPLGYAAGEAYALLTRSRLDELDRDSYQTLVFRSQFGSVSIPGLLMVSASSMFGQAADAKSPMLVKLGDRRIAAQRSPISKDYNVLMPAPSNTATVTNRYYTASLNGGSLWTWQTLVTDIWNSITDIAGNSTLPYTPVSKPENFRFTPAYFDHDAWFALHIVLEAIGCTTAYDPVADTFSVVRLGATQTGLSASLTALKTRLRLDYDPPNDFNAGNMPANVRVFFPRHERWFGIEKDTTRPDNWEDQAYHAITSATGIANAKGTTTVVDSTFALFDKDEQIQNSTDLNNRVTDIVNSVVLDTPQRRRQIYAGTTSSILPGSQISEVIWRDYGDQDGLVTEILRAPQDIRPATNHRMFGTPTDWARITHPIYPRLKQVVQIYNSEQTAGQITAAVQGSLPYGSAQQSIHVHKGRVRLIRAGLEVLEDCYVAILNCFDTIAGNAAVYNHSIYHGRLSGTASVGTDPVVELPLYTVVEATEAIMVRPTSCLVPGGSGTAVVQEWNGSAWTDSAVTITIYDPCCRNCLTSYDPCVWVQWSCEASGRYEILGSNGLIRDVQANSVIGCQTCGSAQILVDTAKTCGSSCAIPDWTPSGCNIDVWVTCCVASGEKMRVHFDPTLKVWQDNTRRVTSVRATLTENLCPNAAATVNNALPLDCGTFPETPAVTSANNPHNFCACPGDQVTAILRQCDGASCKQWDIVAVTQRAWMAEATLDDDLCGDPAVLDVTAGAIAYGCGSLPAIPTAANPRGLRAPSGTKVILIAKFCQDTNCQVWEVLQVTWRTLCVVQEVVLDDPDDPNCLGQVGMSIAAMWCPDDEPSAATTIIKLVDECDPSADDPTCSFSWTFDAGWC